MILNSAGVLRGLVDRDVTPTHSSSPREEIGQAGYREAALENGDELIALREQQNAQTSGSSASAARTQQHTGLSGGPASSTALEAQRALQGGVRQSRDLGKSRESQEESTGGGITGFLKEHVTLKNVASVCMAAVGFWAGTQLTGSPIGGVVGALVLGGGTKLGLEYFFDGDHKLESATRVAAFGASLPAAFTAMMAAGGPLTPTGLGAGALTFLGTNAAGFIGGKVMDWIGSWFD